MRNISLWAFRHKRVTRLLFIIVYALLNLTALFFNEVLLDAGVVIPLYLSYLLCIPFLLALVVYPSKKEKYRFKNFYVLQKTMDGVLATLSFCLVVCAINQHMQAPKYFSYTPVSAAEPSLKPGKPLQHIKARVKQYSFVLKHWKQLKKNYQLLRNEYRQAAGSDKVAAIILVSLLAAGLLLLIAGLSCNLSCSGNEGAAVAVGILGTGLVVFLLVIAIRRINRGPKTEARKASLPGKSVAAKYL